MKKRRIFTQSETLAWRLFQAGEHGEKTKSRFLPDADAWLFDATPEALQIAIDYYKSLDRELPLNIQKCVALEGGADHE